jgi:hypothetical protein
MLESTKDRIHSFRHNIDLILGDARLFTFRHGVSDAIICISIMRRYESEMEDLRRLWETQENGLFTNGNLSFHESGNEKFLDKVQEVVSKAIEKCYERKEMRRLVEANGFCVLRMKIFAYEKPYNTLIEGKKQYSGIDPTMLFQKIQWAFARIRTHYGTTNKEVIQFYSANQCD